MTLISFFSKKNSQKGFTLIESIVGVGIFVLISVSVYQTYIKAMELVQTSRLQITAAALANEQFEIVRNMPYEDIGILAGIPVGKIEKERIITRNNTDFKIIATVRNIDDPFDGTIGGTPNDLSPADYKMVAFDISCSNCKYFPVLSFTTYVGPRALETASTNGALFVRVFNANGQPIQGANVHIENNLEVPAIVINDITNNDGYLQIVDAPPGAEAYEITVTKEGYSQEKTYATGDIANPSPEKPHATVAIQQLTQISFAIDQLSTLNISSVSKTCSPIADIDFSLSGAKLIGLNTIKYGEDHITDSAGNKTISDLEWDTYSLSLIDTVYDLIGVIPLTPLTINPNSTQNIKLIVAPKNPQSLLITIKDASTGLPLSGVTVTLEGTDYSEALVTGRGFLRQTDWSGGYGHDNFIDPDKYYDSDGNVEVSDPIGEIRLRKVFEDYQPSGYLISSSFDTGSGSDFHQIFWQPQDQPVPTGEDSVKFQVATNNDNFTWNFTGPDGTDATFYTISDNNINSGNNNNRYFRYKAYLSTASSTMTSSIADIQFTFTSACVPPGQVIFSDIEMGDYGFIATKTSYQILNENITVSSPWQQTESLINPE